MASLLSLMTVLLGAAPATAPTADSIANGLYHFTPPPAADWTSVKYNPVAEAVLFTNTTRDGQIQLSLLAKDASVDGSLADNVAVAIVKQLKETRTKNKQTMVLPPTVEKDKRFAIVIHEKYKVGEFIADQLHVYKAVGPRVMMMTVNSVSTDPDKTKAIHDLGEATLDGAAFVRKAKK